MEPFFDNDKKNTCKTLIEATAFTAILADEGKAVQVAPLLAIFAYTQQYKQRK